MINLFKKVFWYVILPLGIVYLVVVEGPGLYHKYWKGEKIERPENDLRQQVETKVFDPTSILGTRPGT